MGRGWTVWDVNPQMVERRRAGPPSSQTTPRNERRRRREARAPLSNGFERGWLAFETDGEKRRLAPIPEGWADLPDEELLALLSQATQTVNSRRLIE
jgi:hypothetical protein